MSYLKRITCLSVCLGLCAFAQETGKPAAAAAPAASATPAATVTPAAPSATAAPAASAAVTPPAPVPSSDEIRRVLQYYFDGKNSLPALVDFIPCLKVDTQKGSKTFYQCLEVAKETVPLNTRVNLWTLWYLPLDSKYEDVMLQAFWGEQLRLTEDYKLDTAGRFRTWRTINLNKKGLWTFKIIKGTQELGSQKLIVE